MNQKSFTVVEKAIEDFLKKNQSEFNHFRGRLIKSTFLPRPNQHMVSAALKKVNWYKVEINELEGELEMFREEFEAEEDTDQYDSDQKE